VPGWANGNIEPYEFTTSIERSRGLSLRRAVGPAGRHFGLAGIVNGARHRYPTSVLATADEVMR